MSDNKKLWVKLEGIDMEFEAWELIRLFFDADSIMFMHQENMSEFTASPLMVVKVEENEENWSCRTFFFSEPIEPGQLNNALALDIKPQLASEKQIDHKELTQPGGDLLKSRKILVGSCIVDVLSKACNKTLPYGALTGVRPVKLAMMCLRDGMDKPSGLQHLKRATGMSEGKARLLYDVAEAELPYVHADESIAHLYIGIPFCASRCLYCSFTSYSVQRYQYLVPDYLKALEKEIRYTAEFVKQNNLKIGSVYIGGGTPTSIDAGSIELLLKTINENFELSGVEFTVEAGRPDTITKEKLEAIKNGNVSRISINPQTMNSATLKLIGRNHTPRDIEEKFYMAREIGFDNINMDLIAGLPQENIEMFRYTLDKIEQMAPESLTVHTMALKRASRLHEEQGSYSTTPDEVVEAMIEDARRSAKMMGMRPYYLYRQKNMLGNLENTGYAKPGKECIYNINTMEECQSVLALGAGAISKIIRNGKFERTCNVKEVTQYIDRIDEMLQRKNATGDGSQTVAF